MQSDRYLRAVLTVIAVCLVWICLRDVVIVEPAHAAGLTDVNITHFGGLRLHITSGLPVRVIDWPPKDWSPKDWSPSE